MAEQKMITISAATIKDRLSKSVTWRNSLGLPSKWAENDKFLAGEQWGAVTPLTAALPRPVFNMIGYIHRHKVSAVLSESIKMIFSNMEEVEEGAADWADIFSRYSETTWEEIKQQKLNMQALNMAHSTGIGIWHYFWDNEYRGGKYLVAKGRMAGEILDPMVTFFGDPSLLDVQKQPWILIVKREAIENIKEMAKANGASAKDLELIQADKDTKENKYQNAQVEQESADGKANLIVTYFRNKSDGKIYFQKTCNNVIVQEATCTQMKRYPIAIMNWEERRESIYGQSGIEGIIPNQRVINLILAMQVMSVQLTGFPKMIYKKGFINPNKIRNLIGEMIEDNNPQGPWSAQYMQASQLPAYTQELVQNFLDYTKDLSGAHESNTGEAAPSNASAISLLIKQSSIPLEDNKRRFHQAIEDVGLIWEEFWKVKYNTARVVSIKDDEGKDVQLAARLSDAQDTEMHLKIDIGASSEYSEGYTIVALDKFLQAGLISFEQYLKYVPKNIVPFKESLLKDMEREKMQRQQQMIEGMVQKMNPQERMIFQNSDPQTQQQILIDLASQEQQALQQPMQQPQQMSA